MRMLILCFFLAVINISGCSWIEGYQVRSKAKEALEKEMLQTLGHEFDDAVSGANIRREDYIQFVIKHTHSEIRTMKQVRENDYLASMQVHTISGPARETLLAILKPLTGKGLNSFNFANALGLIHQQQPTLVIEVDLNKDVNISL